jgi:hypothetical protein
VLPFSIDSDPFVARQALQLPVKPSGLDRKVRAYDEEVYDSTCMFLGSPKRNLHSYCAFRDQLECYKDSRSEETAMLVTFLMNGELVHWKQSDRSSYRLFG